MANVRAVSPKRRTGQKDDARRRLDGAWGKRALVLAGLLILALACSQFHYLVPDSAGHVAYARSLLWDRDLDFENEYARLGMIEEDRGIRFGAATPTGRPGNPFGVGSALLWLPWVVCASGLARLGAWAGSSIATDGFGTLTLFAVHLGSWTCALGALVLSRASWREIFPDDKSSTHRVALAGAFLGTPLPYYVLQMPSYSHACSAFTVALVVTLGLRWRRRWTPARAFLLGAATGLAGLVRVGDLGFSCVALGLGLWGGALRDRRAWSAVVLYGTGVAVLFSPQLVIWKLVYGSVWQTPQGSGFLHFSMARLGHVLFSSHHGLLAWSPVVALALVGWVLMARKPGSRVLGVALGVAFVLQWVANAMPFDWWAGYSFGARRFTNCTILFALGLGAVVVRWPKLGPVVLGLVVVNLTQLVRVGAKHLTVDHDPGLANLWFPGWFQFLPNLPQSILAVVTTPFTDLRILRQPTSTPPDLQIDPTWTLTVMFIFWCAVILAATRIKR